MAFPRQTRYWIEIIILYGGVPLLIAVFKDRALMIAIMWAAGLFVWYWLNQQKQKGFRTSFIEEWNWKGAQSGLKHILFRFVLIAPLITLFTFIVHREHFFSFPIERPMTWGLVMLLYPLLSVVPQEMIFRTLFFGRYASLFPRKALMIFLSAFAFGYMHIIMLNPFAVATTFLAGLLIAETYARTRSLALASLEHTLYGCWAYTVGLGIYFYTGSAWGTFQG